MKFLKDPEKNTKNSPNTKIPAIIFGISVLSLIPICLLKSDPQCLVYITKAGFKKDCSQDKIGGIEALSLLAVIGIVFIFYGVSKIFAEKNKGK